MCVYSMVMDHAWDRWNERLRPLPTSTPVVWPSDIGIPSVTPAVPRLLTRDEVTDLLKLLDRAKRYDEETGQKNCEMAEKKQRLKELARKLGQEIEFPEDPPEPPTVPCG